MSAPTATVNGTAVNFAFGTTTNGITITGVSGTLLQNADLSAMADCEVTRDNNGAEVVHSWYNAHLESTLEWVVTGSSIAGAITNSSLGAALSPGSFVTITACSAVPQLTNSVWEIQNGTKLTKSNTTSAKISLPIKQFGGITAVAT